MSKIYFPGLNGLRFIAVFAVILGHIELIKSLKGLPNVFNLPFYINTSGHLGVLLFFVLSGFLITYLLLEELNLKGTISVGYFYLRRILRIWPLYFLMIIISIFFIPVIYTYFNFPSYSYSFDQVWYYLIFLPNFAKSFKYFVQGATHLWSVGIEEQFYLIWPLLILLFRKYIFSLLIIIFIGVTILPFLMGYLTVHFNIFNGNEDLFKKYLSLIQHFKINSMAIGGCMAYIFHKNKKWLDWLKSDFSEVVIFSITFILWIVGKQITALSDEIYSVLFAIIILTLINCLQKIFVDVEKNIILFNVLLYFLAFLFTFVISHLSYKYFEQPFLRLKDKFNY